jgi:hypothetical protein
MDVPTQIIVIEPSELVTAWGQGLRICGSVLGRGRNALIDVFELFHCFDTVSCLLASMGFPSHGSVRVSVFSKSGSWKLCVLVSETCTTEDYSHM